MQIRTQDTTITSLQRRVRVSCAAVEEVKCVEGGAIQQLLFARTFTMYLGYTHIIINNHTHIIIFKFCETLFREIQGIETT